MSVMSLFLKLNYTEYLAKLKRWGPSFFWWGLALCWMVIIFSASSDSNSMMHSSRIIDPFCRWLWPHITLEQLETAHTIGRKGAHMSEYALLALLLLRALSYDRGDARRWISSAWVLATAYAASDEFHQHFIPGRNGCITDVMIDSLGAALGLLACYWILSIRPKNAPESPEIPQVNASTPTLPPHRPSFADQLLCTLQGEDIETRSQVRFAVQDRLQREHGGRLILGRNSATAHLCVKNTSVSGQHLSLIFRNGRFEVEDMDSSNGTRVNGRRLVPFRPVPLTDGDRIEAGEVLLHFRQLA